MANEWETRLAGAKALLANSLCDALDNGVPFSRCLDVLGVEGKAATLIRAMLSRYDDRQIAEMLREVTQTSDLESATAADHNE